MLYIVVEAIALAKDGEGAGRGPCGLRNSELGPRPHQKKFFFLIFYKKKLEYPLDGVKNLFYYCARPSDYG
jgi:hypothetical protein